MKEWRSWWQLVRNLPPDIGLQRKGNLHIHFAKLHSLFIFIAATPAPYKIKTVLD
jgi:hypothetical protein